MVIGLKKFSEFSSDVIFINKKKLPKSSCQCLVQLFGYIVFILKSSFRTLLGAKLKKKNLDTAASKYEKEKFMDLEAVHC